MNFKTSNEKEMLAGTQGYKRFTDLFIESSQALDFNVACKDFLSFLPTSPANILDIGAGAGQNAAALAKLGHKVTAIEPMPEFLSSAQTTYKDLNVKWLNDSLPELTCISPNDPYFDFVLINAVWHHLNDVEREFAATRLSTLIIPGGRCALSLRNGPAGMGTRVYPTNSDSTIQQFKAKGFNCILHLQDQPSIYSHKKDVNWSRIVLQKI